MFIFVEGNTSNLQNSGSELGKGGTNKFEAQGYRRGESEDSMVEQRLTISWCRLRRESRDAWYQCQRLSNGVRQTTP